MEGGEAESLSHCGCKTEGMVKSGVWVHTMLRSEMPFSSVPGPGPRPDS